MGGDWCCGGGCGLDHLHVLAHLFRHAPGYNGACPCMRFLVFLVFLALAASLTRLACRHSTRCPGVFELSASEAMPCLAGVRISRNNPRGMLNRCLPAAMTLNLPVALIEVGLHQKSAVLMLPLRFLFLYHLGAAAPRCKSLLLEVLLLPSLGFDEMGFPSPSALLSIFFLCVGRSHLLAPWTTQRLARQWCLPCEGSKPTSSCHPLHS